MATLLITKKTGDYFSFVLNGDYSNEILNTRNDLTVVKGNESHFKTANGANLIKEQIIYPADVTIVDGGTTLNPTTVTQLFTMLISVGYFDWIDASGGGSGVDKFTELEDTFQYFGKDGQAVVVDEAQMKLKAVTFYNVQNFTDLADVPNAFVSGKWLRSSGSGLFFDDLPPAPSDSTKLDNGGYPGTAQDLYDAIIGLANDGYFPKIQFVADGVQNTFDLATEALAKAVFWNGALLDNADWSQTANILTLTFVPDAGAIIKPI